MKFSKYVGQMLKKDGKSISKMDEYNLDMFEKMTESIEVTGNIKNVNKLYLEYKSWTKKN